jgi:putative glutathione S-transferase
VGLLIDGKWRDQWYNTESSGGEFVRQGSRFRAFVKPPDQCRPDERFSAEPGRYHLFVSLACPWAHRTLILRRLKQLEAVVGVTVVDPKMLENGWEFSAVSKDNPLPDCDYLYQVYLRSTPDYEGRVTVPVLWDRKTNTIVNNESADIIRMLNSAFNRFTDVEQDYYPADLQPDIDAINRRVYDNVNNGVYRAGFATSQTAYETAFLALFETLDELESRLAGQRYLVGNRITEADWRLFTTLVRFDAVYYSHFKCNRQRIEDFPQLSHYLRDLYQQPGVAETVSLEHIKTHYYYSQNTVNPTRIIPLGPALDYGRPHDRDRFG